jgi:hypothetical protein
LGINYLINISEIAPLRQVFGNFVSGIHLSCELVFAKIEAKRGVAQFGKSTGMGCQGSQVQVLSPRF